MANELDLSAQDSSMDPSLHVHSLSAPANASRGTSSTPASRGVTPMTSSSGLLVPPERTSTRSATRSLSPAPTVDALDVLASAAALAPPLHIRPTQSATPEPSTSTRRTQAGDVEIRSKSASPAALALAGERSASPAVAGPSADAKSPQEASMTAMADLLKGMDPAALSPADMLAIQKEHTRRIRSAAAKLGIQRRQAKMAAAAASSLTTLKGGSKQRAGTGKSKKDDDDGAGVSPAEEVKRKKKRVKEDKAGLVEEDEKDDRLYCICQQLYDPELMMIACDKCDGWYHTDCVHIRDADVELVDFFCCPLCEASSDLKTTWKTRCKRTGCNKAVRVLSKFCSDYCGIEVAACKLDIHADPVRFWNAVKGARRMEAQITRHGDVEMTDAVDGDQDDRELKQLQASLTELVAKRGKIDATLGSLLSRIAFLEIVVRSWEATLPAQDKESLKKPKGKKSNAISPDAPCGFDQRLVWDERQWDAWTSSDVGRRILSQPNKTLPPTEHVCQLTRRQCDRHTGWQKLRETDFQNEKDVQTRRLDRQAEQERQVRRRLEDHEELSRARLRSKALANSST
ncbi:uncharacterized protein L969DRAFT_95766 [Mixia osmundae IAM 14324]|uniref:CXXC-type zinc finger protein 1 n=1 Tax=Mixia osmundae (strain CBS 9802 / IAM 14324 / JCM 22182 / KY 12970) TaxID=764103 RepID=G7DSM8_MIXOS|nr:uncharacterized protein L969DRAFT_95766 [Mixia osmundae IAM 14324]KEI37916.1 hypothetical protein L969DRAFT_95766 [Mixia osmundae IAM 14324]GAA93588.1 hypothetical protein E5Q_00232 [Mixia osmundae IAM 14324]